MKVFFGRKTGPAMLAPVICGQKNTLMKLQDEFGNSEKLEDDFSSENVLSLDFGKPRWTKSEKPPQFDFSLRPITVDPTNLVCIY